MSESRVSRESSKRVDAVQTMMGVPLGKLAEKADAIVLIFGTGCVFLRPEVDEEGNRVADRVECPPSEWTLDFDHPGGRQRVKGLRVKATEKAETQRERTARVRREALLSELRSVGSDHTANLADVTGIPAGATRRTLEKLEAEGLVRGVKHDERDTLPNGRVRLYWSLTEKAA